MPQQKTNLGKSALARVTPGFIFCTLCLGVVLTDARLLAQPSSNPIQQATVPNNQKDLFRFELTAPAMGSHIDFVVFAPSELQAKRAIDAGLAEIERLSKVLSNYEANSEISKLCSATIGQWTPLSLDLAAVLDHSRRWHKLSDGKFDITVGPLTQLWRTSRMQRQLPTAAEIEETKSRCGWNAVNLQFAANEQGLSFANASLSKSNMILDLSGLAVGYIVDAAFDKMAATGVRSILINAGGDIRVGDAPPGTEGWRIMIAGLGKQSPPLSMMRVSNCAVTTSGDLNQYIEVEGRRYSHFIEPQSGEPIERRQSVTALAATTVDADAGATALAILGSHRAWELFQEMPLQCAMIMETAQSDLGPIRTRWLTKD